MVPPVINFTNPYETAQPMIMMSSDIFAMQHYDEAFAPVPMAAPGYPMGNDKKSC